jgi:small subunit ribosomal protein S8
MITDQVSNFLTKLRNAQRRGHKNVEVAATKNVSRILDVLKSEGFIEGYKKSETESVGGSYRVSLKYYESGEPMMSTIKRISKPGRRVYSGIEKLHKVSSGLGIVIISTSKGIMSDRQARKQKLGGELIAVIGH